VRWLESRRRSATTVADRPKSSPFSIAAIRPEADSLIECRRRRDATPELTEIVLPL
jgi:hypothetical protein